MTQWAGEMKRWDVGVGGGGGSEHLCELRMTWKVVKDSGMIMTLGGGRRNVEEE